MTRPRLILLTVLAATVMASSQSQASLTIPLVGRVTEVSAPPWFVPGAPVGAVINMELTYDPDTHEGLFSGTVGSESFGFNDECLVSGRGTSILAISLGFYSAEPWYFSGQLSLGGVDFLSGTGTATGFLFVDRDALPGGFAAEVYSPPVQTVPEPATVAMIASGLPLGLVFWCWKRRRAIA